MRTIALRTYRIGSPADLLSPRWAGGILILLVLLISSPRSWGVSPDSAGAGPVIEAKFVLGPDKCPTALQLWLVSTPDTIQGLEVFLTWDRPDFAVFATKKPANAPSRGSKTRDSVKIPSTAVRQPVVERSSGLLKQWEYFEARGEDGLWAKVTALAYLMSNTRPSPIVPGDSGALFSIPLVLAKAQVDAVDGDSAVVRLDNMLTRFSDTKGNLLKHLIMRDAVVYVTPCRMPVKKSR